MTHLQEKREKKKKSCRRKNIEKSFRAFFFFYEPQQTDSKKQVNMLLFPRQKEVDDNGHENVVLRLALFQLRDAPRPHGFCYL